MLGTEEISETLKKIGFRDTEIETVIADVTQVAVAKVLVEYFSKLSADDQVKIKTLSSEEVIRYIEEHKGRLPALSEDEFKKGYDETWKSYLASVSK